MGSTSKSPNRVLLVAHGVARRCLPAYSHRCSPKKFTQHQLFACLVLKEFLKLDYRGTEGVLLDSPSLRAAIGLQSTPDFTTLQKASRRLLKLSVVRRMLGDTLAKARQMRVFKKRVPLAAIDASGFEAHHISNYFVRRRARDGKTTGKWQTTTYRRFPKLAVVCDCHTHLILAAVVERGPKPDFDHWIQAMSQATDNATIATLLADAGYDAEWIHLAARIAFGVRTLIPPKHGRPSRGRPTGYYRRRMATHFNTVKYRQRSQVETDFSMLKRLLGSAVNAYSPWSQRRALLLKVLTINIMILRRTITFQQSRSDPFLPSDCIRPCYSQPPRCWLARCRN
jgi:transposase